MRFLGNISFNVNKIVFYDPLYYNLKASKLLGDGLTTGYQTYICSKSGSVDKSTAMSVYANINTTSLDQLISTSAPLGKPANSKRRVAARGSVDSYGRRMRRR